MELRTYRTARIPRRCDMGCCGRTVQPGDRYLRGSLPPGMGANAGETWWTYTVCAECMSPADRATVQAAAFNAAHPVGTPVRAYPGFRPEDCPDTTVLTTRTRSAASVLGGHTAVVWVEGHGACIALTHIDVITTENAGGAA